MPNPKIRVRIERLVEVDIEAWAGEYGIAPTVTAVREDVKSYFGASEIPDHLVSIVKDAR